MLTQRSEGLRRLLLICQICITAGLFWIGVWVMVKFYSPGGELTWRRYSIYCVLLVLGLTLEYLGRDSSRDYPLQTDLLREHRVSLRQAVASIGTLLIYLIATKDGFISRVFLFNFVPCFYLTLLFSHHYLPAFLARRFFKGIRAEKTLLVGSPARAAQLHNWLQQKSEIGLHTAGLICPSTIEQAGDLPILGQPEDFIGIVRACGATQAILLEFPRTESNRAIIDACDELGVRLIILSDLEEMLHHPVVHFEDGGFRFMALREEPLENPLNRSSFGLPNACNRLALCFISKCAPEFKIVDLLFTNFAPCVRVTIGSHTRRAIATIGFIQSADFSGNLASMKFHNSGTFCAAK